MDVEREVQSVTCPRCGPVRSFSRLASSDAVHRYQCGRCLECFPVARLRLLDRLPEPGAGSEEEAAMAKLKCPKCGKAYRRGGKLYEKHVAGCSGPEGDRLERVRAGEPSPAAVPPPGPGSGRPGAIKEEVLRMLEAVHDHHEGALKETKLLIATVREVEVPGADAEGGGR